MMERHRRVRSIGLTLFLLGTLGLPGFSLVVPGDDLWKQIARVGFLVVGMLGVILFGYGVFKITRSR